VSGGGRTPEEVLGELGRDLDAAIRSRAARHGRGWSAWRGRWRLSVALLVSVAVGASTAAATTSIFSSSPPLPRLAPLAADLASGVQASEPWRLSVARCSEPRGAVSLLLRAGSGGAGTACGEVVQPPAAFYDPRSARAFVFGAVPAAASRVELALGGSRIEVTPRRALPRALKAVGLPPATRVYVARVPASEVVTAMTAFDASGRLVVACQARRCERL
jgi:hypothetical protein